MSSREETLLFLSRAGGRLGTPVDRAAAADPQNVWLDIFTIAGGLVLITSLIGVRTVIQAGGASNMQFQHSIGPTPICAVAGIAADGVGTIYSITGIFADALQIGLAGVPLPGGLAGSVGGGGNSINGIIMAAGTIQVTMTAVAGTGSTRYVCHYIPIDSGATVVAA